MVYNGSDSDLTIQIMICIEPIAGTVKSSGIYPAYWTANLINNSAFLNSLRTTQTCQQSEHNTQYTDDNRISQESNKNSSGDEIANVKFLKMTSYM